MASSKRRKGLSGSGERPFLSHFVGQRESIDLRDLSPPADLREFISRELGHALQRPSASGPRILILTGVHDTEANLVGVELLKRGVEYIRVNSEDFPSRASISWSTDGQKSEARIIVDHEEVVSTQISCVWSRYMSLEAFALPFDDPVATAFALQEWRQTIRSFARSLGGFWVNPPDAEAVASDKLLQLRMASEVGLDIPRTTVTNEPSEVRDFYDACGRQIIAKAVGLHFVEVQGRLYNFFGRRLTRRDLDLLGSVRHVPSIFQEYIPKRVEVRATVVGEKIFPAEIHSQLSQRTRHDYHRASSRDIVPKAVHDLPSDVARKCRLLMRRLGLLFGALDLILTPDGRYVFLEVNSGGAAWRWIETETDLSITDAVVDLLIEGANLLPD